MDGIAGVWRLVSMTRTTNRWKEEPGNFDKLNMFQVYPSSNKYGIPTIKKDEFLPEWLVPYRTRIRTDRDLSTGAVHFFLDDYRFEPVWHKPFAAKSVVENIGAALSPDFSTYVGYPMAVQLWNIYRNRWVGAFWQSMGVKVIPTVSWSDESSFEYCFLGIEKGSHVAISTVGALSKQEVINRFKKGYIEMINRIEPSVVLCYGEGAPFNIEEYNRVKWYPTYWKNIRDTLTYKGGTK